MPTVPVFDRSYPGITITGANPSGISVIMLDTVQTVQMNNQVIYNTEPEVYLIKFCVFVSAQEKTMHLFWSADHNKTFSWKGKSGAI